MSLLIIAWSLSRSNTYTRAQGQGAGSRIPGMITAQDAAALEDSLAASPDNLSAREQISCYFIALLTTKTEEIEEKRERHVFWLIEHHPESELAGSPETGIEPPDVPGSTEGYQHGKAVVVSAGGKKIPAISEFFGTLPSS